MRFIFVCLLSLILFSYWAGDSVQAENEVVYLGQEGCDPCEPIGEQPPNDPCDAVTCDADTFNLFSHNDPYRRHHRKSFFDSLEFFGWIQGGVYANSRGNTVTRSKGTNYKGRTVTQFDPGTGNGDLHLGVKSTDFQVNQLWLGVKRDADGKRGLDWGFAAEVIFGTEGWIAQSYGDAELDYGWQDGDYSTALPQLYFQLAYGDLSVKVGKFETIIGYEPFRAANFFFYSHSYIFNLEPYSHSGAFFEYNPVGKWSFGAAYTTGGNSSIENTFDDHGFLGLITYQLTEDLSLSYAVTYNHNGYGAYRDPGDTTGNRYGLSGTNVYLHTVAASYNISDKWNYALQWNYNNAKVREDGSHALSYGIANTLTYQFNERWGIGFRAEWANLDGIYGFGNDISEYTLGVNWKPYSNISIRPEIRYDYSAGSDAAKLFNNGKNRDQFSGGIASVVTF